MALAVGKGDNLLLLSILLQMLLKTHKVQSIIPENSKT